MNKRKLIVIAIIAVFVAAISIVPFAYVASAQIKICVNAGFTMQNNLILYDSGNFNLGIYAYAEFPYRLLYEADLYSVTYKASWLDHPVVAYQWTEGSPNPQSFFFCSIDLVNVPHGSQYVEVTASGGGRNDAGNRQILYTANATAKIGFIISALPSSASTGDNVSTWSFQTVSTNGLCESGQDDKSSIVLDSHGNPKIAYTDFVPDNVNGETKPIPFMMYASWNGFSWSTQTLGVGRILDLYLDANDTPHVVCDGYPYVTIATANDSSWFTQTTYLSTVAVDFWGNPHGVSVGDGAIYYVSKLGAGWTNQTIDTVYDAHALSLVFSKNNMPYVLYTDDQQIKVAIGNESGWNVLAMPEPSSIVNFGNMAIDSLGYPHFIYSQSNNTRSYSVRYGDIMCANWNGTAWNTQKVATDTQLLDNSARTGSLAIDSHNNPHITYTTNDGMLTYCSIEDGNWNTQNLTAQYSATKPGALVLDSKDNPHIFYYGTINQAMGYGSWIWQTDTVYATGVQPTTITTTSLSP
jgi:hypothetical protein